MRSFALMIAVIACCASPVSAQQEAGTSTAQLSLDDLRTFTDVFNQLRTNFVLEVDDHTLLNAAIDGMISQLDPYSEFLDSDQSQDLDDASRGRYAGIGVQLGMQGGRIVVNEVHPGGPAALAGVKTGDLITAVDGRPVRDRKIYESLEALSGEPGTEVDVRFKTGGKKSRELKLLREFIQVPTVSSTLLKGAVGYFEISHFNHNSKSDLENEIQSITEAQGSPLNGIILDLRSNPGGVLRPAVEIADGFLETGLIMRTRGRYEATRLEFNARPGEWIPGIPLVLLVNGETASASEVLTGALKDHGRAVVIGERTFGKGSIQSIFNLRNGTALKLTTAHYFTPSGEMIHGNGIEPDIVMQSAHEGLLSVDEPASDSLVLEALRIIQDKSATEEVLLSGS